MPICSMAMGPTLGSTESVTMESGIRAKCRALVSFTGRKGLFIVDSMRRITAMAREK